MISLKDIWQSRKAILEGIKNTVFPNESVERIAEYRLSVCATCNYHSNNAKSRGYITSRLDVHCTYCSCPLATKARALSKGCPINKWTAVLTADQQSRLDSIEVNNKLKFKGDDDKEYNSTGSSEGS